jgi:hypothetical protein
LVRAREKEGCTPSGGRVLDFDHHRANLETRLLRILDRRIFFLVLLHLPAPTIVERRFQTCQTWKLFATFGDERSIAAFVFMPDVLEPYAGLADGASYVSSFTRVSTVRTRRAS